VRTSGLNAGCDHNPRIPQSTVETERLDPGHSGGGKASDTGNRARDRATRAGTATGDKETEGGSERDRHVLVLGFDVKPTCRHCHRKPVNRPRGMCWNCYYTPGVRNHYGCRDVGGSSRKGLALDNAEPPPCPAPTTILPGPAKVAVLAARAEAGVSLFHPQDAGGEE